MNVINILLLSIVVTLIYGCDEEAGDYEDIYLPYYEICEEDLLKLNKHLDKLGLNASGRLISLSKQPAPGKIYNDLIELSVLKKDRHLVEASVNRFLHDCGPNAMIRMKTENLNENAIRVEVGRVMAEDEYDGLFLVEIEGDEAFIYFSQER